MNETGSTFQAHAFHPGLGNEVADGTISVDRWHFRFHSDAVELEIPLPRLQVRMGEGGDERVYFTDPEIPGWEVFTTDTAVLDHPSLAGATNVREQLSTAATRQELWRRLRIVGYVVGACVLVTWIAHVSLGLVARSLIARVPASTEKKMGDEGLAELKTLMDFQDDTNRTAKLADLATPLTQAVDGGKTKFTFYIAADEDPNAFALPGGHVVVTTGLLKMMERPEELLGVISHEVAHVTKRHALRESVASAGPILLFQVFLGGGHGIGSVLANSSDLMVRQGFSQDYELEADATGWETLVAANIDPRGMTESLRKLQAYEAAQKDLRLLPQAFSSHPAMEKRIARLEKKWRKLPRKDGFIELKSDLLGAPAKTTP